MGTQGTVDALKRAVLFSSGENTENAAFPEEVKEAVEF